METFLLNSKCLGNSEQKAFSIIFVESNLFYLSLFLLSACQNLLTVKKTDLINNFLPAEKTKIIERFLVQKGFI